MRRMGFVCITISCIFILICSIAVQLICQVNDQIVNHYTLEQGLPSMTVYDVVQDSKGFIWVATESGVSKFDGYNFTTLTAKDGLLYNEVIKMFIDSKDRIWLNTSGPISYIENDSVYFLNDLDYPNMTWEFQVKEDEKGDIWLAKKHTIVVLDGESLEPILEIDDGLKNLDYFIYAGIQNDAVYYYNEDKLLKINSNKIVEKIPFSVGMRNSSIYKLKFMLKDNKLYYANGKSLSVFDLKTRLSKLIDPNFAPVKNLFVHDNKIVTLGNPNGMIVITLDESDEIVRRELLFEDVNICNTYVDNNNFTWVSTFDSGIYLLKPESKILVEYLSDSSLETMSLHSSLKDPNGVLWVGSENGTFFKIEKDEIVEFVIPFANRYGVNRILDIDYISADELLLTTDIGLIHFNRGAFSRISSLASKQSSIQDRTVLISTYYCSKLIHLDSIDFNVSITANEVGTANGINLILKNRSYANYLSPEGVMWISDEKEGLIRIDDKDTIYYRDRSPIFTPTIKKLVPFDENTLVAASKGEGLIFIEENDFFVVDRTKGLSNNSINDLYVDGNEIYVSTNSGLNIVTVNDLKKRDFGINVIGESYGLKTSGIHSTNVFDDKILLFTSKGMIAIKKDKLKYSSTEFFSPFYFKQLRVNDSSVPLKDSYEFDSDENNLIIEYSGIIFSDLDKTLYAYKMDGVDEDWIFTRSRETHYSQLKPGDYTFRAALVSDESDLLEKSSSIDITIKQHFTQTIWFKALMFLLALFLIAAFFYYDSLRREKGVLSKMVKEKTSELDLRIEELAMANAQLEMSNKDLENFAYVTSHDLKSPLRNITSFIQLLEIKNISAYDKKDKEYIKFIKEGVGRMENTINDLLLYSSLDKPEEASEINIYNLLEEIKLDLDYYRVEKGAEIKLEGDFPIMHLHVFKIKQLFQNLIENGLKYNTSNIPKVTVHCVKQEDMYLFSIKDNGIGIEKKYQEKIFELFKRLHSNSEYTGTGIGLAIGRRVVESYGGKMWLDSVPAYGSTFYFTIPSFLSKT